MQAARLQRNGTYMTIKDSQMVAIHPGSILDHKPEWLIYHELVLTKKNYVRTITEVKGEWLFEINADYFNPQKIRHVDTRRELEKVEREMLERKKYSKN